MTSIEQYIVDTFVRNFLHHTAFFLPLAVDYWLNTHSLQSVLESLLFSRFAFELRLRDTNGTDPLAAVSSSSVIERELLVSSVVEEGAIQLFAPSPSLSLPLRLIFPRARAVYNLTLVLLTTPRRFFNDYREDAVAGAVTCRRFVYDELLAAYINRDLLYRWTLYFFILKPSLDGARLFERRQIAWLAVARIYSKHSKDAGVRNVPHILKQDFLHLL